MIKYWLKLWTVNENLFEDAIRLIENWKFDFIELYIIPDKFDFERLSILKEANIDISFHLPHSAHWFNPIDKTNNSEGLWKILSEYIEYLKPFNIILHPEFWNTPNILRERLKFFDNKKIIIENMPMKSSIIKNIEFYWYNLEQIRRIKEFNNNFCFDFAKAKSSAISQKINPIQFSDILFREMEPKYFHISGFLSKTESDEHYDIWEWDNNLMEYMKGKIKTAWKKENIFVVFECKKKNWLDNDIKNLDYFLDI